MQVTLGYGEDKLTIKLPDNVVVDEFQHKTLKQTIDFNGFSRVVGAIEKKLFDPAETDLVVVNDAYRCTPTATIIKWLVSLRKFNERAEILISTGTHAPPTSEQMHYIFDDLYDRLQPRIRAHDCRDKSSMQLVGHDSFDQPVYLNRSFLKAEKIIVIGSVEPHYFAGFTGGRKAVFPGLCDRETIVRNHRLARSFKARPLRLEGNPVEEHLQSLMDLLPDKKIAAFMTVQAVTDRDRFCLAGGTLSKAFEKAVGIAADVFAPEFKHRYDLLLAETLPPLDANLYQLQKSLENCQAAVNDDGTIILFSACREGIGSDSFYRLADSWRSSGKIEPKSKDDFGIHKLSRVDEIGRRINIHLHSQLPAGVPERVFFRSLENPQTLIDRTIEEKKIDRLALVRDAGHTVLTNNHGLN